MYSKTVIEKSFKTEDGSKIMYEAIKLDVKTVGHESFKILRCLLPSTGVAIDSLFKKDNGLFEMPRTFAEMFTLLADNLTEDHFSDLAEKLLGGLRLNDKKVDIEDHFEKYPEHFYPVLLWLGEETFSPFLTRNSTFRSLKEKVQVVMEKAKQTLNDSENSSNDNETEDKEK